MQNFDSTPDAVTYFRINAVGFGVSILSMFVAMYWWMGVHSPQVFHEPVIVGILVISALFTAGLYLLPALVPRKMWGYVLAWVQLSFALTSMTATLPSLAVVIAFAKSDVKDWFSGDPVGFQSQGRSRRAAVITALIGYYTLISVAPFGFAYLLRPDQNSDAVALHVAEGEHHVVFRRSIAGGPDPELADLGEPEEYQAEMLGTGTPWNLENEEGPVAVTVWASYCGSCTSQFRTLAEHSSRLGHETRHVSLALDCERNGVDNRGAVRTKLGDAGITSLALCRDGETSLDPDVLPTTVFFDADGTRRATAVGYQSYETLDQVAMAIE